jgi:hypothetical protein
MVSRADKDAEESPLRFTVTGLGTIDVHGSQQVAFPDQMLDLLADNNFHLPASQISHSCASLAPR